MSHLVQIRVSPEMESRSKIWNFQKENTHSVIEPVVTSSNAAKASPTRTRPSFGKSLNDMNTDLNEICLTLILDTSVTL